MLVRFVVGAALLLAAATVGAAFTASNTVPATNVGSQSFAIGAQDLAPPQCAGMGLTAIVTNLNGSGANELVLGTAGADSITARGGNDCVVGGDGDDTLNGGAGTDVCIGGPGTDTFSGCETQIQ